MVRNFFCLKLALFADHTEERLVWWHLRDVRFASRFPLQGAGAQSGGKNGKGVWNESGYEQGVDGLIGESLTELECCHC